jgi:hypothetical protein
MLNIQFMLLSASSTDEVMSGTEIKQNDNGVSVQGEHTTEDMLALRNIFHGRIVDAAGHCNDHLLRTTWRVSDVALSDILLQRGALSSKVA